ncbi:hypothetical protein GN956_G8459 [Arapaima gigas]
MKRLWRREDTDHLRWVVNPHPPVSRGPALPRTSLMRHFEKLHLQAKANGTVLTERDSAHVTLMDVTTQRNRQAARDSRDNSADVDFY